MSLLSFDEACDHLRIEVSSSDDVEDVQRKIDEASEIVVDYVTHEDKADWTDETAPNPVKAAIKLVLTGLYDERDGDPLTVGARSLLRRYRTPPLA